MNKLSLSQDFSRSLIIIALILFFVVESGNTNATNLTVNFGTSVGTIRQDFYGVNTHGVWGTNFSRTDFTADNSEDLPSNSTEHLFYMDQIGFGSVRFDMSIGDNMLADGSDRFPTCTSSNYACLNLRRQAVNNSIARSQTIFVTGAYMITNLATNASNCASDHTNCMPQDVTYWAESIVVKWLNTTGLCAYAESNPGKVKFEAWNEPDLQAFFLPDISTGDTNRSTEFNRLYNATWNAIKGNPGCDAIEVGGPSLSTLDDADSQKMFRSWVGNFSNGTGPDQWDFITIHEYYWNLFDSGDGEYDGQLGAMFSFMETECSSRNADCTSNFILGEWNTYNSTEQRNYSKGQFKQIVLGYAGMLNNYPSQTISTGYDWTSLSAFNVTNGESGRDMVWFREKLINGNVSSELRAPYNATVEVKSLHQPGASVVNWTADDNKIALICSYNSSSTTDHQCTVINRENSTRTVLLNLSSANPLSVTGAFNSTSYTVTGGAISFSMSGDEVFEFNITTTPVVYSNLALLRNNLPLISGGRILFR